MLREKINVAFSSFAFRRAEYTCTAVSGKVVPTKAEKHTQECRLVLWVERVWCCLIEVHGV